MRVAAVIRTLGLGRWPFLGGHVDHAPLAHLSLLGWEHINLAGDYVWRQS